MLPYLLILIKNPNHHFLSKFYKYKFYKYIMQILLWVHTLFQNIYLFEIISHIYAFDPRRYMDSLVAIYERYRNRALDAVYSLHFDWLHNIVLLAELIDFVYRQEGKTFEKSFWERTIPRALNTVTRMQARYGF